MREYLTFVSNALVAATLGVDRYFQENQGAILKFSKKMRAKHPIKYSKAYRGILLEDHGEKCLKPLKCIQFLSFSEDLGVAKDFADPRNRLAFAFMIHHPDAKGYLIEHTPQEDEIIFHYSWIEPLGLKRFFSNEGLEILQKQKEVTLRQDMKSFNLVEYSENLSLF